MEFHIKNVFGLNLFLSQEMVPLLSSLGPLPMSFQDHYGKLEISPDADTVQNPFGNFPLKAQVTREMQTNDSFRLIVYYLIQNFPLKKHNVANMVFLLYTALI